MKFDQNQVMGTGAGTEKPQEHTEPAAVPSTEESGSGSKTKTIVSIAALSVLAVIGLLLVFFNMRRIFIDQKAKEPASTPTAAIGETMGDLPDAVDPGVDESQKADESQVPETGASESQEPNAEESQISESEVSESQVSASELANENESLRAELEGAISDKELANQELQNAKTLLGQ